MGSESVVGGIWVEESAGRARVDEAIRIGIPIGRGLVRDVGELAVVDPGSNPVPSHFRRLAVWPDRSLKWVLMDALACVGAQQRITLTVMRRAALVAEPRCAALAIERAEDCVAVDTGAARFEIRRGSAGFLSSVRLAGREMLAEDASAVVLRMPDGTEHRALIDALTVEDAGPVRASVLLEGTFGVGERRCPMVFKARLVFVAGKASVRIEFLSRNPQAARHPGGLWDLGDEASLNIRDLSIRLRPRDVATEVLWAAAPGDAPRPEVSSGLTIYQDSSGGENWDSPNHIDAHGRTTVSFRGYRVTGGIAGQAQTAAEGDRATPWVQVVTGDGRISGAVDQFWQNFPKALRWVDGWLSIGLFPSECRAGFELQGGEQKRHFAILEFGMPDGECGIPNMQEPLAVGLDPALVERAAVIPWFAAADPERQDPYERYISNIVDGPHSFFAKREIVDEYGWRNFGDLYADHEAVNHCGGKPLVSHYNNQYDFIHGALVHFLRCGDGRWRTLMEDAAHHCIDIDIYHTREDRAAYNGGLFWHTDHYKDAATSTHRTYSRLNGGAGYGGGPSNEHNYTSGLLEYFYLTGDAEARESVCGLADWVLAMDDGNLGLLGLFDSGPTGFATKTASADFHGPGRGAGNSINALLDAHDLTAEQKYLMKAEELIRRCIHPSDDLAARRLDDPESRWSYLAFLQVLGKYLDAKRQRAELDYHFHYAREALLHYANWMVRSETPYKDVLHKVQIPTETWPAHDIRKCHVLFVASQYAELPERHAFQEKAEFFFQRCLSDLLSFETAYLTRPMVILCVYGYIADFFRRSLGTDFQPFPHAYSFGEPAQFRPQRERAKAEARRKARLAAAEIGRMLRDRVDGVVRRQGRG